MEDVALAQEQRTKQKLTRGGCQWQTDSTHQFSSSLELNFGHNAVRSSEENKSIRADDSG